MDQPESADGPQFNLQAVSAQPFKAKVTREDPFAFGSITTTEVCNLTCVMCHFNGPQAIKKGKELSPESVRLVVDQLESGSTVYFAATGEFFMDPHAVEHVKYAIDRGIIPLILSHGQLYTKELMDELLQIGVRGFRMSCDAIDASHYARIRIGGKFQNILDTVDYLNARRGEFPDITIEVNCTLFKKTFKQQTEFEDFWRGKIDALNFNAEYHDIWEFRNIFYEPAERSNCRLQTYVLPSGKIAPCCAVMVHAHDGDTSWLPSIETHTLKEAYTELCDMYDDPASPLAELCRKCDWWIMWSPTQDGATPYLKVVRYDPPSANISPGLTAEATSILA